MFLIWRAKFYSSKIGHQREYEAITNRSAMCTSQYIKQGLDSTAAERALQIIDGTGKCGGRKGKERSSEEASGSP